MNTELNVSYDTTRQSQDRGAYRVTYADTADAPHELRQIGPVCNNIVHYRGVYTRRQEAERAADSYIGARDNA